MSEDEQTEWRREQPKGLDQETPDIDWGAAIEAFQEFFAGAGLALEHPILFYLEEELEVQSELLAADLYKTVLIRQSTFMESFLTSTIQIEIEDRVGHDMSNRDLYFLQESPPKGKVRMGYWFGVLEEDERNAFLELMDTRGDIAHTPWVEIESAREDTGIDAERIANRIYDLLKDYESETRAT